MRFRFILQPLMAAIAAIRDGREDAPEPADGLLGSLPSPTITSRASAAVSAMIAICRHLPPSEACRRTCFAGPTRRRFESFQTHDQRGSTSWTSRRSGRVAWVAVEDGSDRGP
jgi:hypothetical protein